MAKKGTDSKGTYVVVERGDTLTQIAVDYAGGYSKYKKLAAINGISNPNRIAIGTKIYLSKTTSSGGSSSSSTKKKSSNTAKIKQFGLQSDLENTLFATWTWDKSKTENYKVQWQYYTKDKYWFVGNDSETNYKYSTYQIPSNATRVRFRVRPISKTYTVKTKESSYEKSYWTAEWTDRSKYAFNVKDVPPTTPSAPTVELEDVKLTATLDNIATDTAAIEFHIVRNDSKTYKTVTVNVKTRHASYSCTVPAGSTYKVRARAVRDKLKSSWSDYSSSYGTAPATPKEIETLKALSETSVQIDWTNVSNATQYVVEYTTKKMYFDSSDEVQSKTVDATAAGHAEITGLTSGEQYFFRVKATNDKGESEWCPIKSITIGKAPAAPTTWSSTTTAIVGETINLYWVHNSEDESSQTFAQLELDVNGSTQTLTIKNNRSDEDKDKTSVYPVNTIACVEVLETNQTYAKTSNVLYLEPSNSEVMSGVTTTTGEAVYKYTDDDGVQRYYCKISTEYAAGAQLKWRVRTAGITKQFGDWSVQRIVDVYAEPSLELSLFTVSDSTNVPLETLSAFPFYISAIASPNTQIPVGYNVTITANELYDTVNNYGDPITVREGDAVYSKYFDISEALMVEMSANNVTLENGITYTVTCIVSMNSGLTAAASADFTVSWTEDAYVPNAEIGIDTDSYTAVIQPYCETQTENIYKVTLTDGVYTKTTETIDGDVYGEEVEGATTETGEPVYSGTTDEGVDVYYCTVEATSLAENVTLSVYRREFDGKFTEIGSGLANASMTNVTDPHPALDYARYRIVAKTTDTGTITYYDVPNEYVGGSAAIIQWDEETSTFAATEEITDAMDQPSWTGSMLMIPYNIDVSDSYSMDVEQIEYIGRSHPVTYYGTQLGQTSSWSMEIPKDDKETLYGLRRLAIYPGDVYVREPSGSGYWANVSVSFSQTHCEVTIPITLTVTRVEGGM